MTIVFRNSMGKLAIKNLTYGTVLDSAEGESTPSASTTLSTLPPPEFTQINPNQLIKVLTESMIHYNFQYKEGLNVDTVPFNPTGTCQPGGLYYTQLKYLANFIEYGVLIADVELPYDASIYVDPEGIKWKADKIILKNIKPIQDHPCWNDPDFCYRAVSHYYKCLKYVKKQTHNLCKSVIMYHDAISYIRKQTLQLCIMALKHNPDSIQYIHVKTPELCMIAIINDQYTIAFSTIVDAMYPSLDLCITAMRINGDDLKFVSNKTPELCAIAVLSYSSAIGYINLPNFDEFYEYAVNDYPDNIYHIMNKTLKLCIIALQKNGGLLKRIDHKTPELCMLAVKNCGWGLKDVKNPSLLTCIAAIQNNNYVFSALEKKTVELCALSSINNTEAIAYIDNPTLDHIVYVVKKHTLLKFKDLTEILFIKLWFQPNAIHYMDNTTIQMCLFSLRKNGNLIMLLKPTPELCQVAVRCTGTALQYIKHRSVELCIEAVRSDPDALVYVPSIMPELVIIAYGECALLQKNSNLTYNCQKVIREAIYNMDGFDVEKHDTMIGSFHLLD